ncbi:response regulator [Fortiea sp. LEGE XX443]|uniref:response regulator n=1 Tax=Fortiea sp. LEGE XX443 TaxID=1828611 RepID=UPI001881D105|nr:response regulator [Fortiea sp. LEGE XX443]MBE9007331.1 response regulator [Fortiea sp. LEGE XX443]
MKLLVVEDDELNAYILTEVLNNQNYAVEVASDGETAWDLIQTYNYDLILLDVMLPKLDGISLCRQIRSSGLQMPILLLTGRDSSHEKAIGLDAGADDYVVKPFEREELVARVRALLRRSATTSQPVLEWGNLRLDPSSCEVTYRGDLLSLTPKEYALLELFLRNSRRVFSCGMILEHLWSYEDTPGEEAVRTHIKGLRQRLKAVGAPSDLIETVYGIGYRLRQQEEEKVIAKVSVSEKSANSKSKNHKSQEEQSPQPQTLTAIDGVWQRFQGRVDEQVKVLEQAALTEQALNSELLTQALKEAHTLAGSLGTFGFPTGSKLARKIEQLLKASQPLIPEETAKLQTWVKSLRQEIQIQGKEVGSASSNNNLPLVLVVDRDHTVGEQLAQTEFKVTIATNLQEARTLLYREHPSAVLLDPSFSDHQEDSLSFLAELAQRKPPVPVLVFTEQTDLGNRLQLARQGGHTFLQKPLATAQIADAIAQLLQQSPQGEAKILAVDDDPQILALLQTLLSPWGLQVISLDDPRRFWETLETVKPDLLILDVEMPHSSGIELCQVVRNDPNWSELPILFLTVHSDADIVNQVYSVGADDFVNKPIVGPELVTRIVNRLERMKLLKHMAQTHQSKSAELKNLPHDEVSTFSADWRTIFEGEPECVKVVAGDGTLLEMNPAGLAIIEANSKANVIGESVYSLIAPEYQQTFRQLNESVCQGNKETLQFEIITCQGNRRWMETHAVPLHNTADGKFVQLAITRDITNYKQAETEIRRINRTLQTLSNCNQVIVRTQDEQDLLDQICQIIVDVGGYRLAWVGFAEDDAEKNIRPVAQAGYDDGYLQTLQLTWSDTVRGQGPTGTAIRTGKTSIIQNILIDPKYEIWRCQAQERGYAASIALPLKTGEQAFGALNIYAAEPNAFDHHEVQLLKKLAEDLTYGIVALRNQRDRQLAQASYTQLVELCPEAIFIQSEGKFLFLNSAAIALFGATKPEELLGKPVIDLVHPNFQALVQERIQYLKEVKQPVPLVEEDFVRLNGEVIHLEVVAAPCEYQQKPAAVVVARNISHRKHIEAALQTANNELELRVAERTAELITVNRKLKSELDERQRIEEELRVSQVKFARILDIADDAIISIDSSQNITLFNQGAEKIFGYSAQEVIGQKLDLLLPLRFTQAHRQHVSDFGKSPSLARRMGERRELFGQRQDGSEFPAEASISKLNMGEEVYYTVILRDVTDRKQIERMKDEFVSVVSHELRTPLTSIHGSLGMLTSGLLRADSDQGKRLLQIATDSTERLVRLINDILDIERIESGKVKMAREVCNLADLIQSAVNVIQPLAHKQGVTLAISSLSVRLWADPDRIIQTLTNLVSNAIKFSSAGQTVCLEIQQQQNEVLLIVKDTGRGIPEDKLESIFERFQQVDSSDSRNHDGTGLGLAICQSIVQQHGGRIWAESTLGEGSTFYLTLPIQKATPIADSPLPTPHSPLLTPHSPLVLVCDDDPAICTELQTLLQQGGYRVVIVATGEEAIATASTQQPDVILLDLLMPGMNGWQTMAVLKERADTKQIPIVICSVYQSDTSNKPITDFADWVSKPVQESYLLQSLKQVIATPCKRARILIVEDDNDLAQLLITLFERHDIETCLARTGREAIHLSQELNPDLLILDLILPESDGFMVIDWLKQHNHLCTMPVVVYSAQDLDESERQRLKLGYTEFLTKGRVTTQEFEQRVMELLQRITHNSVQSAE